MDLQVITSPLCSFDVSLIFIFFHDTQVTKLCPCILWTVCSENSLDMYDIHSCAGKAPNIQVKYTIL
jgi:hypothetical protein